MTRFTRTQYAAFALVVVVTAFLTAGLFGQFTGSESEPIEIDVPETIEQLHEDGHTGSGVTVGLIDVTGIDDTQPAVADSFVADRTFGDGDGLLRDRPDEHGTRAAALVAATAPDAELYFASVGDEESFTEAVSWQLDQDVDIIVAPVSFYGKPGDGNSLVERAASDAVAADVAFVAPAGNLGQGHWQSRFLPTTDGYQEFDGGQRMELEGDSERVELWLSWQDRTQELTVELYAGDDPEPIAASESYAGDRYPNELLTAEVPDEESLSVALRGPATATGEQVRISSPTHELSASSRLGSLVPPGTAEGVLTVGAYNKETGILEPYSGAGPTADGRPGLDIIAPGRFDIDGDGEFFGTSAGAPYTAGVAALLLEQQDLSPPEITEILTETADGTPPYDDQLRAGSGVLRPERAILQVADDDSDR